MIAIIDHYDSFTYNLVHIFEQLSPDVRVFQHDRVRMPELKAARPQLIVLSPGPGSPADSATAKPVLDAFAGNVPILGVCLGHQAIVDYYGGDIINGSVPVHGKVSQIIHEATGLFDGVPNPAQVVRYHSLIADEASIPDCLQVTARSADGVIMGVRHRAYPVWGIQFHPESILTTVGTAILANSIREAAVWFQRMNERRGGYDDSLFAL